MILLNDVVEVATAPHPYAFPLHAPGSSFHEIVNWARTARARCDEEVPNGVARNRATDSDDHGCSEARIRATRRHQMSRVGIGSSHDHWRADVCYEPTRP